GRPGTGWLAAVLCLLVTSPLLSPQFFVWAAPAAALALFESRASAVAAVAFAVACAMTTAEYNFFTPLYAGVAAAQALVILRNAVCLVALGLAVRAVIGVPPQRRSAEAQ
ncbi:MAG: hypothetical protein JOY80_11635, partial [Candidatus Dormibacteraeota bacterium]|nr:hypothetical protein [Candidatus Dormibacteraeota bacterium]